MFYKLEREYEPKVIGVRDASSQAELVKELFDDKSKYDFYRNYFLSYKGDWFYNQTRFPETDFDLEYLKLKKRAILTDFLSFAPSFYHQYLVSEKVRSILANFNLPPYKYYHSHLSVSNEFTDEYSFFFCPSFNYEFVDFEKSRFSIGNKTTGKKLLDVKSLEQYLQNDSPVNVERMVLKGINHGFDYFNCLISPAPLISERLKDVFVKEGINGIRFIELTEEKFLIL